MSENIINPKKVAAEKAVEYIREGMIVGLGTGSTSFFAIQKIGELVKAGLNIKAVASSIQSEKLASELNIPVVPFTDIEAIDIYIDGADEVDKDHNLIKGGGAAHLREKILASNSAKFLVIVDESKLVDTLGKFPLPVEMVHFASSLTIRQIKALGCSPKIRQANGKDYISDNGNLILDCQFDQIKDPANLSFKLLSIPGVVETGLFLNSIVSKVIVSDKIGNIREM